MLLILFQLAKYANNTYPMLHLAFCNQYLRQLQSRTTLHWNLWSTSLHIMESQLLCWRLIILLRLHSLYITYQFFCVQRWQNFSPTWLANSMDTQEHHFRQFFSRHYFNYGTKLRMIKAYNPPTDGQTEVLNRVFSSTYELLLMQNPSTWGNFLHWSE